MCALAPYSDFELAMKMYEKALGMQGASAELADNLASMVFNNMGVLLFCAGHKQYARDSLREARNIPNARSNIDLMNRFEQLDQPLSARLFSMAQIEHPAVINARLSYGLRLDDTGNIVRTPEHQQMFWDIYGIHSGIPVSTEEKSLSVARTLNG